jgi:amino acid adenylation domain-containing protein
VIDVHLRDHLARHLPHYMVPALFVELDDLPLTPSRKVDLRALPDPRPGAAADREPSLEGLPGHAVPADRGRPAQPSHRFHRAVAEIEAEELRGLGEELQVSVSTVLCGAWAVTLYRHSGQSDLVINASTPEQAEVPLRLRVLPEQTFAEFVRPAGGTAARGEARSQVTFHHGEERRLPDAELALDAVDRPDGRAIGLRVACSADLFDESTAALLLTHLREVARSATSNVPIALIELASAAERAAVADWGAQPDERTAGGHPLDLIEAQVVQRRDEPAVTTATRDYTYAEIAAAATAIAATLAERGVGPGDIVALYLDRSPEALAAMLGSWRAGAAYLPVDPDYPAPRTTFMLEDSGAAVVLTTAHRVESISGANIPIVAIDAIWDVPIADGARPARKSGPDDCAYIIYTSGSTGRPKGVRVPHGAVANLLNAMSRRPGLAPDDVMLALTSPSFDIAVWELFGPLAVGARTVLAGPGDEADVARLAALITEHGVTTVQATPITWEHLAPLLRPGQLRRVVCGGEALSRDLANTLCRIANEVWNGYGPTEATVYSLFARVAPAPAGTPVPIGTPVAATKSWVVDDRCRPQPPGVVGELCVGGAGLAMDYHRLSEMTAQRFPQVPVLGRLYRTGDLARLRPDGQFEFLGRVDGQVKIRGHRIETGEIASLLRRHPAVRDAVVVARTSSVGTQQLVAYVVPARGGELAHLTEPPQRAEPVAVPGGAGSAVARLWWSELEAPEEERDPDAGFLALGGHSLLAMRLRSRLRAELRVDVPLSHLLTGNLSLAKLEELVRRTPTPATQQRPAPSRTPHADSPLTPAQRRIWILSRLMAEPWAYNVVATLRLEGTPDPTVLRVALADVIARHDALRAYVVEDPDAEPRLRYAATVPTPLEVDDTEDALTEDVISDVVRRVAARTIELTAAPLIRAGLLSSTRESCLVVSLHHLVADQRSLDLVLGDLATAYAARKQDRTPDWDPAPSFAEYAHRAPVGWDRELDYWRARLRDVPPQPALPFGRRPAVAPSPIGASHVYVLGATADARLDAFLRHQGTTAAVMLSSCIAVVLAAWTATDTVVLGMPASTRQSDAEDRQVGYLLSTLPIRLDLAGHARFAELLRHTAARHVEALEHGAVPFDVLVDALGLAGRPTGNPLFNTWVNDLTHAAPTPPFGDLRSSRHPVAGYAALFDLNFYLMRDDGYRIELVNAIDRVAPEVASELLDQVGQVLSRVISDPAVPLDALRVAPAAPVSAAAARRGRPILDVIRETSARTPNVVAVRGSTTISYADLLGQIDAIADGLHAAGVGAGTVVEVLAQRTSELAVALLGVWSAGAVAAIIDRALPDRRIGATRELVRPAVSLDPRSGRITPIADPPRELPEASHVLLTTGTTGVQAAVAVPAGALADTLSWYANTFAISSHDRFALLAGLGHDPMLRDLIAPLCAGATVTVPPPDVFGDPTALWRFVRDSGITVLNATPALIEVLVAGAPEGGSLGDLRLVVCGGAPLTTGAARRLRAVTGARIVNAYGATETPQIASCHVVAERHEPVPPELADGAVLPVGTGSAGAELHVVDADGRHTAVGRRGEIVVHSPHLASGYLDGTGRPGAFGRHTFRTGDYGRRDPWGMVHVEGRIDRQLLVDGFRVAPEEVEAAAMRHDQVRQASAFLGRSAAGGVLSLDVVPVAGPPLSVDALRRHLQSLLPAYAVPFLIRVIERPELDANHKVRPAPSTPPAPCRTSTSVRSGSLAALAELAEQVLGRPLDDDENFFDGGLTSIGLIRFHTRIQDRMHTNVPVTALFAHPTLRALAAAMDGTERWEQRQRSTGIDSPHDAAIRRRDIRRQLYS